MTLSLGYLMLVAFVLVPNASALSGSSFNKARIIDDPLFFRSSSMSATGVQSFLNSKVPACDTNGTEPSGHAGYATRADWGRANGNPPPYTCLKSFKQNTPSRAALSGLCNALSAKSARTAAQIIYDVSKACGIDSKVLIVMLQKEQALVTDEWPWAVQYRSAMGYGCPDTAPCSKEYYGFFNQVYNAAKQLKNYRKNPSSFNYASGRKSYVSYQANAPSCGKSYITMQNAATAALYNYTPYQPNAAALANLYGTGDSCSAYGNRNFWRMFNDWFGSTSSTPLFRINNGDAVYIMGSNNNYYHVTSPAVLEAYGLGNTINRVANASGSYVSGKTMSGSLPPIARFEGDEVYFMNSGKLNHFTSRSMMQEYGYDVGGEAYLPAATKSYYTSSSDMQQVSRQSGSTAIYYVDNGKKRHITSQEAYDSGSPSFSSRDKVSLSRNSLSFVSTGAPILTANKVLQRTNDGSYAFWDGSSVQNINKKTAIELGLKPEYKAINGVINQLAQSGTTVNKLVKNGAGQLYLLDSKKKYLVSPSDLSDMGLTNSSFQLTSNGFLSKIGVTKNFSKVVKVDGSSAVYLVVEGKLRHALDKNVFSERGLSINQVVSINARSASLLPYSSQKLLSLGALFKIAGSNKIYLVNQLDSSLYVPGKTIMQELGLSSKPVTTLSASQVSGYPREGKLGYFVKNASGASIWLLYSGNKRASASATMANSSNYNLDTGNLPALHSSLISRYNSQNPLTSLVQASGSSKVYSVVAGQKRWVTSTTAFNAQGFSRSNIRTISTGFLSSLPTGSSIN